MQTLPRLIVALLSIALSGCADAAPGGRMPQILMIGDSLSVGPFGTTMQAALVESFGGGNVSIYASCGSSPEHWLATEPVFITRCGYRERTPRNFVLRDYENGRRPPASETPKIERLLAMHRPDYVIVQLGTNWFDDLATRISQEEITKKEAILARFGAVLRDRKAPYRKVIWVLPPDSAKFSRPVQNTVRDLIVRAAKAFKFEVIQSRDMTNYVRGRTGSDGVHYNGDDARKWALGVMRKLRGTIPVPRVYVKN